MTRDEATELVQVIDGGAIGPAEVAEMKADAYEEIAEVIGRWATALTSVGDGSGRPLARWAAEYRAYAARQRGERRLGSVPRHPERVSGESVLHEMYDLIRRRLPDVAPNDPARSTLTEAACALGDRLGRPRAVPVSECGMEPIDPGEAS